MLNIGIISESLVQQHYLHQIVQECGYRADVRYLIKDILHHPRALKNQPNRIDIWLVDIDAASLATVDTAIASEFENWLYNLQSPVIFSEGRDHHTVVDAGFCSWSRQLKAKLLCLAAQLHSQSNSHKKAKMVWVLAASVGGPEAVKCFLDALPPKMGIGFIYVQHIDMHQNRSLAEMISRDSSYVSYLPENGDLVCVDSVIVVPANLMEVQRNGTLIIDNQQAWRGNYSPSIDQVTANVADIYGPLSGSIFFTGMGDDGVIGSRLMAIRGGQIWIQSPHTCQSASMPKAIEATGYVTTQGSPEALAAALVQWAANRE